MENKDNLQEHLKVLSVDIGHRGPTTENEKKASEYIASIFSRNNITTKVEEFLTVPTFTWTYFIIYFLFVVSFVLFFINSIVSLLISLSALLFFITEIHGIETISKILPKRKSQNVIGEIKSNIPNAKEVILVAHYDTSRAGSAFSPKMVKHFKKIFLVGFFSQIAVVVLYFANLFLPFEKSIFVILFLPFIIFFIITIVFLLEREFFYPLVAGANDNGSGTVVLLSLAEYFSKNRPENLNITFLATGAEEVGCVGMVDYLKKYKDKVKKSFIINFDNLGSGNLKYTIGEGMINVFYTSRDFTSIIKKVINKNKFPIEPHIYRTAYTDATICLARGYKATSIMAFDKNNIIPNWHWITDTYENVDIENLQIAENFAINLLKEISQIDNI